METQLLYQIGLTLIPGIGDVNGKKLIQSFGSAESIFHASKKDLMSVPGMGQHTVQKILSQKVLDKAEKEIRYIEKNRIQPLFFTSENYPQRLLNTFDHPLMLYYKGNADLNHSRIIAFVGTRRATEYGKTLCRELMDGLKDKDVLMVSGLAYGIDGCAHQKSLDLEIPTIGVLGHGLDRIYPAQHKKMANAMLKKGGLLTEFLSGTNPDRENFPKRNRIVAGMCDALVVVESGKKGGALITAELANSYNRDVFALPGKVVDKYSEGCNFLIKINKANLIQSSDDIAYIMGWDNKVLKQIKQPELFRALSPEEQILMKLLTELGMVSIDKLIIRSKLNPSKVAAALLNMEFNGWVQSLPGKQYKAL